MPDAVMIQFGPGMDQAVYDEVNGRVNPPDQPPEGLILHFAGQSPEGWRIVDVWDSRDTFDTFFQEKVQPVLLDVVGEEALSQGTPPTVTSWPVHNHETPG
jgi:hypothetical protein